MLLVVIVVVVLVVVVKVNVFDSISITGCGRGTGGLCVVGRCFCIAGSSGFLCFLLLFIDDNSGSDTGGDCSGDDIGGGNSRVDPGETDGKIACISLIIGPIMSSASTDA
jgi:hypothetical protein